MNPAVAKVTGLWVRHKPVVLAAGAGLVVVLGYRHHQNAAASSADSTATSADGASITGYAPAGATGGAAYDSTGNDVYNALQPQIEQTQSILQSLMDKIGQPTKIITRTVTVPAKPAKKKAKKKPAKKKHAPRRKPPAKHPSAPPRRRVAAPAARAVPPARQVPQPAPRRTPVQSALPRRKP